VSVEVFVAVLLACGMFFMAGTAVGYVCAWEIERRRRNRVRTVMPMVRSPIMAGRRRQPDVLLPPMRVSSNKSELSALQFINVSKQWRQMDLWTLRLRAFLL
jgi:hypothetical protein